MPGISQPMLFGSLVALSVMVGFVAVWRLSTGRSPTDDRLQRYASRDVPSRSGRLDLARGKRADLSLTSRLLDGFGLGRSIAYALARADLPLTAAEFSLIVLIAGAAGFLIGVFRAASVVGPAWRLVAGLILGAMFGALPIVYLQVKKMRRQRQLTEQLPDLLTLLVGSLRAGHGLSQALEVVVDEVQPPAKTEFARVIRAVSLGTPIQTALHDMADRVGIDDLDLIVVAITAQYEMGGNLATTLETISETVRDRINMLREVRVLTAQQRYTGYVLGVLPIVTGVIIFAINPSYMRGLFEPGWVRLLPVVAVLLQVMGFILISRIVDIEV